MFVQCFCLYTGGVERVKMLIVFSPCFTSSMYYCLWERKGADSTMVFLHIRTSRAVYVLVLCGMSVCWTVLLYTVTAILCHSQIYSRT